MYEQSTLNERQLNTDNDVQANTPASSACSDQPLNVGCPTLTCDDVRELESQSSDPVRCTGLGSGLVEVY